MFFLFNLLGYSWTLSLFFCGVVDRFLFFPCPLGIVSSQSGEEDGSGGR